MKSSQLLAADKAAQFVWEEKQQYSICRTAKQGMKVGLQALWSV